MLEQKKKCFIITPIGDETEPIRRHIEGIIEAAIKPALGEKYDIIVAHEISEPGSITKQVINEIYQDDLVIANLTGKNPNVMYELALRHAIAKPAIMIAEKGTALPSDIIMQRTIFYHNDAKGTLELKKALVSAETEIKFSEQCGPIYDVLGDISHDQNVLQTIKTQDSDSIEPFEYILNRLNRIEDAIITSQRKNRNIERPEYPHLSSVALTFDNVKNEVNIKNLINRLSDVRKVDSDVSALDVRYEENDKLVLIVMELTGPIAVPEVYQFYIKVLSEFGFTNVHIIKNHTQHINFRKSCAVGE